MKLFASSDHQRLVNISYFDFVGFFGGGKGFVVGEGAAFDGFYGDGEEVADAGGAVFGGAGNADHLEDFGTGVVGCHQSTHVLQHFGGFAIFFLFLKQVVATPQRIMKSKFRHIFAHIFDETSCFTP